MGRKSILKPHQLVIDGDMSGDITSEATSVQNLDIVKYFVVWTGTPTGEFIVQQSMDKGTWYDLDFLTTIDVSGAAGNHNIHLIDFSMEYSRIKYVRTSGTGTLQAFIEGKVKGA